MREVREREVREVRGERRRNIWKKGRVDFKKKKQKNFIIILSSGWVEECVQWSKKKKENSPSN